MSRNRFTKLSLAISGLLTGLLFATAALPLNAQTAGDSHPYYDVAREVTINGTVSAVLTKPVAGMIWGPHLLLATTSGQVDASLGRWGLQGKGALSVTVGQQVELTGVMKTLNGREVLLARTVKAGGKVYTMRNEHGIPVSPQARERGSAQQGEPL
jgi:hypothetical protein